MKKGGATEVAEARLAEIERRRAETRARFPEMAAALQSFDEELGPIRVRKIYPLESER